MKDRKVKVNILNTFWLAYPLHSVQNTGKRHNKYNNTTQIAAFLFFFQVRGALKIAKIMEYGQSVIIIQ